MNLFNNSYPVMMPILVLPVIEPSNPSQPAMTTHTNKVSNTSGSSQTKSPSVAPTNTKR
jgi:hypothetical protein